MTQSKPITKKRNKKQNFPFDVQKFEKENKDLIRKYKRKNTKDIKVPDFDNMDDTWYYSANENLLRGRLKLEEHFTLLQKLEWIKCRDNIIYFIEKYVEIISIDDGVIPFNMYDYQKELIKLYNENRFVIATQCRQSGKTQTTAAYLLHFAIFNSSKNIAILANKGAQAQEILERIQQSYEFLPKFLQGGIRTYNKRSMKLDNLSQIFCAATSSSSIRGKSIACVSSDAVITVRNKETQEVERITMGELENRLLLNESRVIKNATQSILKNTKYEVLTESGWQDFEGLVVTEEKETILLDDYDLECTKNHRIKLDGEFVEASTLNHTEGSVQTVYDLLNVDGGNHYITNDITSHNCLYIDETAFIANDTEFFESTYPVISSGKESRVILTSTPNGQKGYFYKTWIESLSNKNLFKHKLVTWENVPGRDQAWFDEQVRNTSYEQVMQEHGCQFRGSQNSLLNVDTLGKLVVYPTIEQYDKVKIYEEPVKAVDNKPPHIYAMCVDTSMGVGKDYSAFIVVDISQKPFKVVATFRDNYISPLRFPYIIQSTAQKYNDAFVLVENNVGNVANDLYYNLEYENVFTTRTENRQTVLGFGLATATSQVGIRTTVSTKSTGITNIKTLIERNHFIPSDKDLIDEYGTFIPKGKSYEADKNCHDDMVMCSVLFGWLSTQEFFEDLTDIKTRDIVINRWKEEMEQDFTPFGIIDSNEFGSMEGSADAYDYQSFESSFKF